MNDIREIVTKAVVGKGKKTVKIREKLKTNFKPFSILGCWVINHEFEAQKQSDKIEMFGTFEINVWYAYDDNTKTEVAKSNVRYSENIKTVIVVSDYLENSDDVIVRIVQQPTCTDAKINGEYLELEIVFEAVAEVIGETKISVTVFNQQDMWDETDGELENEIDEDFLRENI